MLPAVLLAFACLIPPQGIAGDLTHLRVDQTLNGEINNSDPPIHAPGIDRLGADAPVVGKSYRLEVVEPGTYTIELRSYFFDAYLVLHGESGEILAEDDDGLSGSNSRIIVELTPGARRVDVCALHAMRGVFELKLLRGRPMELSAAERARADREELGRALAIVEATRGPEHPDTASALNNLGRLLSDRREFAAARPYYERALAIREKVLGPDHPETALSLYNLAFLLRDQGDSAAARPYFERALAIREKALGPEHADVATTLNELANVLGGLGDYKAARPLFERALAIRQKVLGPDHIDTAESLNDLGVLLADEGEFVAAQPYYERALTIHEKVLGPEHWKTATILNNLGVLCADRREYAAAQSYYERTLRIRERALGLEHPDTASTLNDLAVLFFDQRNYTAARPLYERALAIREKALGPEHLATAASLDGLARTLREQGEYAGARPIYERALAIREKALGAEHPLTVESMVQLGILFWREGNYGDARPLLERALSIRERLLSVDDPAIADTLANLAAVLSSQGDHAAAFSLMERAASIYEKALGSEHPRSINILHSLAHQFEDRGDYSTAQRLFERALSCHEKATKPETQRIAEDLNCLGHMIRRACDYESALPLLERAFNMRMDSLGVEHPDTAFSRSELALLLCALNMSREAWGLFTRDRARCTGYRINLLASLSEAERYSYLARYRWHLEVELAVARLAWDPRIGTEAYEDLLAWKGQVTRLVTASRAQLMARMKPEARDQLESLRSVQSELSTLVLRTDVPDPGKQAARIASLRDERNRLELAIERLLDVSATGATRLEFSKLCSALPARSAALDFFIHADYRRKEGSVDRDCWDWTEPQLSAWITRRGSESPVFVDLGPAIDVEIAIRDFLQDLVVKRGVSVAAEPREDRGAILRDLLWTPLAYNFEDVDTIFVSPDGVLGGLPFEVLPLADGHFAIERYAFVYMQDMASLAEQSAERRPDLTSLLSIGGVDMRARAALDEKSEPAPALVADASFLRGGFADYWPSLPATRGESQVVFDLHEDAFGAKGHRLLLQDAQPTEERLKQELSRFSIVHLATHGFFQPEGVASILDSAQKDVQRGEHERLSEETQRLVGQHPGLLSGVVCAGANKPEEGRDDGYLTAEEVGWLDLSKVDLVVLSACETGLGRAQSGEGMLGLRRAFHLAGAKTVISSLWSVRDESTADLMRAFYRNLWSKGQSRLQALRSAQLAMLARNRVQGDPRPSMWGAFVLSGEWR